MWIAEREITGVRAGTPIRLRIIAQQWDNGQLVFDHLRSISNTICNKICSAFVIRVDKQSPAITLSPWSTCSLSAHHCSSICTSYCDQATCNSCLLQMGFHISLTCVCRTTQKEKSRLVSGCFALLSVPPKTTFVCVNLYLMGNGSMSGGQHQHSAGIKVKKEKQQGIHVFAPLGKQL